jgi:hypothetical protein
MPNRLITGLTLALALHFAASDCARAQSAADAAHAMRAMDLRMRALNAARKSLQQLASQLTDREAQAARDITDADTAVFADAVKVYTVAFFLSAVKCPQDERLAQRQFGSVVAAFVTDADAQLSRVNASLADMAAPAALAEAMHIRDVMLDLRQFLQPFATAAGRATGQQ